MVIKMKHLLFLLLPLSATAQNAVTLPLKTGDTVVNAGTAFRTIALTDGYSGVVFQPVLTKISGTVAGTVVLYESLDNVYFKSTGDTMTNTNVTTNTVLWHKIAPVPVYYKLLATGTGTMSAVLTVKYVLRKYSGD